MNSSKKAVLIGAGQFGRGVIAMCLSKSGYDVLLADIDESVIEDINSRHEYKVTRIFGKESSVTVRNVSAINSKDDRLIEKCADCDIICTCTGLTVSRLFQI
jgi:3-hydroxyacyl-CoA dehydrogenase